jgi:hypothetical protein
MVKLESKQTKKYPERLNVVAKLASGNIHSFYIIILMGLISLTSIIFAMQESKQAANNIKVAWVKMYPNGTWDVEFYDEGRGPDFFQSTVDYILRQWVERRYSRLSRSVKEDFGYVNIFMSEKLKNDFVDPNGFDAVEKAAEIANCSGCEELKLKVRNNGIDHFDSDKTTFGQYAGTLYRSNIFANKITVAKDGVEGKPEKVIVPIQWRIKSKEEIQADKSILKQNPIGLEIMSYEILEDVSP